jgi:hypothetical protein
MMKGFRKFAEDFMTFGDYENNPYGAVDDRSGAVVYFDVWKQTQVFGLRVYHIEKHLDIALVGDVDGQSFYSDRIYNPRIDEDTGEDRGEYCTKIHFHIDLTVEGSVALQMDISNTICSWSGGVMKDFLGNEAKVCKKGGLYLLEEILTDEERQGYVLEDRVSNLRRICRDKGLKDLLYQINYSHRVGGFPLM